MRRHPLRHARLQGDGRRHQPGTLQGPDFSAACGDCDLRLTDARTGKPWGAYALQGAIAACHARARQAQDTDWPHIVALYDALLQVAPSPVVALNRFGTDTD